MSSRNKDFIAIFDLAPHHIQRSPSDTTLPPSSLAARQGTIAPQRVRSSIRSCHRLRSYLQELPCRRVRSVDDIHGLLRQCISPRPVIMPSNRHRKYTWHLRLLGSDRHSTTLPMAAEPAGWCRVLRGLRSALRHMLVTFQAGQTYFPDLRTRVRQKLHPLISD